ncbi:hypothetical protein VTI74DRAFT_11502 [Chaetomium olivicolor]
MRPFTTLVVAALAAVSNAAAVIRDNGAPVTDFDAIVVGGGPAGLSALSGLARVRRKVLLIDSGEYRNAPTRHMHDVLGFDGVTPAYFRWAARQQLSHYTTITMINGTVTKIAPGDSENSYFTVSTLNPAGDTTTNITARKIILATGLRDILPLTPGVRENWGQGIFWCPWCDGHEHADQPLGLLGSLDNVPSAVREMVTLNKDVIALVNGTDTAEFRATTDKKMANWQKYLEIHNVKIDNRTIAAITRLRNGTDGDEDPSLPTVTEHDLFRVDFTEGPPVERAAFLAAFPSEQTSKVGEEMGVQLYGGRLAADPNGGLVTNIPGVYAIGDANSDNVTNVPHALFSGKRTAVYLHVKIAREDGDPESVSARALTVPEKIVPQKVRVFGVSLLGSGCLAGTADVQIDATKTLMEITFSEYIIQTGPGTKAADCRKNCKLTLNLEFDEGFQCILHPRDRHVGLRAGPLGRRGLCTNTFDFTGIQGQSAYLLTLAGPREGPFTLKADPDVVSWSPCGGTAAIMNMNTQCNISPTREQALIAVDRISGKITVNVSLDWRKCR